MIDLHNHVLPGIDDGSDGMRTSLRMLEQAILQGITHVVCTSHANDRSNAETDKLFHDVFSRLKGEVKSQQLPIELGLAAEIMFGTELKSILEYPFATYNGKGEYFLVEYSRETPWEIIINVIKSARRWGKRPVIAHVERFRHATRHISRMQEMRAEGAILTMDAGALLGQFGKAMIPLARNLVSAGTIDILCSDAHNADEHGFCLKAGFEAATALLGQVNAQKMVLDKPRLIWDGTPWPEDNNSKTE